jgi:ferritin-like metal-binding protein YciE
MTDNTRDRTIRYLQDAHAAETGMVQILDSYIDDTDDTEIRTLFQSHMATTRSQADRLEQRLRALGGDPSGGKGFLNSLVAKAADVMNSGHDEYDKNVMNLVKAYGAEHGERAMYESLYAWASAIGDMETARLAQEIQMEEEQTAERIFPLIRAYANSKIVATSPGDGAYAS